MPFDIAKFEAARFEPRRERVRVEALAAYFPDGDKPEWEIRGLSAAELHRAMEAAQRQSSVDSIVKAIAANGDAVQAIRRALGITADTPGEIAKRIEMIVLGSLAPKADHATAVKLGEHFPIEFMTISNRVAELTGQGSDLAKPEAASQPTPA